MEEGPTWKDGIQDGAVWLRLQQKWRTPALDRWFQAVSFIGSPLFYMVWLPIMYWIGLAQYGRHLTALLALGIYFCHFFKDYWCLPRPMSPPVFKLPASNHYVIEYGFPSSHAVNALLMPVFSVLYCVQFSYADVSLGTWTTVALWTAAAAFALNVSFSRLYCGMHSITDLIGGFSVGGLILWFWLSQFDTLEHWCVHGDYVPVVIIFVVAVLSLIYPDPVDPTPSYADSLSFIWVLAGIVTGTRLFADHPLSTNFPARANVRFSFEELGLWKSGLRIVIGVGMILAWRVLAKKVLFVVLPPIYRLFNLPARKFHLRARDYEQVKAPMKVAPSVLHLEDYGASAGLHRRTSSGDSQETAPNKGSPNPSVSSRSDSPKPDSREAATRHAFYRLPRYDVEVFTRCIVYFGIGWLAAMGVPICFDMIGLAPALQA